MRNEAQSQYWREFVAECLSEHGVTATEDQAAAIARDFGDARYGFLEAFPGAGGGAAGGSKETEEDRLRKELEKERDKRGCGRCAGHGYWWVSVGTSHQSREQCWICGGSGKV